MKARFVALILAGGLSKRFRSSTPKIFHELLDRPMIAWVIQALVDTRRLSLEDHTWELLDPFLIVTPPLERVPEAFWEPVKKEFPHLLLIPQPEPKGTGDAVRVALPHLPPCDGVLILCGDTPCITPQLLKDLLYRFCEQRGGIVLVTATLENPQGYGRVLREGQILRIVEEKDATPEERRVKEINAGIYVVAPQLLHTLVPRLLLSNAQKEYYLVDLVHLVQEQPPPPPVTAVPAPSAVEVLGVNDRLQLTTAAKILNRRLIEYWSQEGVSFLSPETTWLSSGVELSSDVLIEPLVVLRGRTRIGSGSRVGMGSYLQNTRVGENVTILPYVIADEAEIEAGARVGPFAHLRPRTLIREGTHIGNFVELKNTRIGPKSKANHLSYLGDAEIGRDVNVGAGTITCNYDGIAKHPTIIEDGAFIGSDTQLVAPVRVGRNAYVGAGTTVTRDVAPQALAISRVPQKEIPGYAQRRRSRSQAPEEG